MSIEKDDIIRAILLGENSKALDYLYKTVLMKVRHYIKNNSGSLEDANDVFQDAVIVLFDYVKQNKFDKSSSIDGFVFRVAKNIWIDKLRRKKLWDNNQDEIFEQNYEHSSSGLDILLDKEKAQLLNEVFQKLGDMCKQLLHFQLYEKLSMKEISTKLGYENENVAKSKNYKCKKKLASLIKQDKELLSALRG